MAKFGLVTEGITDQIVIENILCGFYKDYDDLDEEIFPLEPPRDETDSKQAQSEFGIGWSAIFNYLSERRFRDDVLNSEYVIIQIDTDIAEEMSCSKTKPVEDVIECVIQRMVDKIDSKETFYAKNKEQIIFAISVHSLECWILPIYSNKKSIIKCEDKLKYAVATSKSKKIQKLIVDKKDGNARNNYNNLTQKLLKHKELMKIYLQNTSFEIFINKLPKDI